MCEPSASTLGSRVKRGMSPEGDTVGENLNRIGLDSVLSQQRQVFFLERPVSVMLGLIADVGGHLRQVGYAHAECGITFLPREGVAILVDPLRGVQRRADAE